MKIWFPLVQVGSGSDVYTNRLADSLVKSGIDTCVTTFPGHYEFAPHLLSRFSPPDGTSVIHTNSWNAFAFRKHGIPVVTTVHLPVMDASYTRYKSIAQRLYHNVFIKYFERTSISKADRVTAVSNFVRSSIQQTYNFTEVETIYNFVDTGHFLPAQKPMQKSEGVFKLLFIGNLTRRKGADLLEPIMQNLGDQFLLTATTGLRSHKLRSRQNNIINAGKLTGMDLVHAYQQADALIFPSRLEGFGYAVLEAMSCGIPVIASDNSSIPEIVQHNETGILCPTDDVNAFADACRLLAEEPGLCKSMGVAARKRAIENFSAEVIIPEYITLYKNLTS